MRRKMGRAGGHQPRSSQGKKGHCPARARGGPPERPVGGPGGQHKIAACIQEPVLQGVWQAGAKGHCQKKRSAISCTRDARMAGAKLRAVRSDVRGFPQFCAASLARSQCPRTFYLAYIPMRSTHPSGRFEFEPNAATSLSSGSPITSMPGLFELQNQCIADNSHLTRVL